MSVLSETPREQVLRLWGGMKRERDTWLPTWREICELVVPWRARFMPSQRNDGRALGADIVNSVATRASGTAASGLQASLSNAANIWFRLTTADPGLAEFGPVRAYLFQIERLLQWVFARSNVYNELHTCYRDLVTLGTAPLYVDESDEDVIRAYVIPVGQYAFATNHQQRVDTVGRQLSYTVRQLIQRFGIEKCSPQVRKFAEKRENLNQWIEVLHLVCPNEDLDLDALDERGKPFRSVWMELGNSATDFLAVKGYRQFPVMGARWEVTGTEDIYGHSPVREVLPDIRQLQHTETKKIELTDKALTPPMQGPASMRGDYPSMLSGSMTYVPENSQVKFEPAYIPDHGAIQEARTSAGELELRIRQALHEDLWRMLVDRRSANGQPGGMTATEVAERHEEKLVLLGPAVERIHNELLSPLIKRTLSILAVKRQLPPPPDELVQALVAGDDVKIEYLSVLAQAQKLLGLGNLERFTSIASAIAATDPSGAVMDKVDRDEALDQAADMLGIPPNVVRSDDAVAEMRISRARQAQRQQQVAESAAATEQAKTLAQTPMNEDSALSRLLASYGPVAASALPEEAAAQ